MSSKSPAEVVGIIDVEIAFAFNMQCADTLHAWELEMEYEREKRQLELLTGQSVTSVLSGTPRNQGNTVERW